MRHYKSQLVTLTGKQVASAGGKVFVAAAGASTKVALLNKDGSTMTNPSALTNGSIEFWTADSVAKVDLYIQSPTGHFIMAKGITPSGDASIAFNAGAVETNMVIPFSVTDQVADATETPCGFVFPAGSEVQPFVGIDVVTVDAGKTIMYGTIEGGGGGGDLDGYAISLSLTTAGFVKASLLNGAVTLGPKLFVQDSANAGDAVPEPDASHGGRQVTYTISTGATVAAGFLVIPLRLRPSLL